jgi:hypothetical protein
LEQEALLGDTLIENYFSLIIIIFVAFCFYSSPVYGLAYLPWTRGPGEGERREKRVKDESDETRQWNKC